MSDSNLRISALQRGLAVLDALAEDTKIDFAAVRGQLGPDGQTLDGIAGIDGNPAELTVGEAARYVRGLIRAAEDDRLSDSEAHSYIVATLGTSTSAPTPSAPGTAQAAIAASRALAAAAIPVVKTPQQIAGRLKNGSLRVRVPLRGEGKSIVEWAGRALVADLKVVNGTIDIEGSKGVYFIDADNSILDNQDDPEVSLGFGLWILGWLLNLLFSIDGMGLGLKENDPSTEDDDEVELRAKIGFFGSIGIADVPRDVDAFLGWMNDYIAQSDLNIHEVADINQAELVVSGELEPSTLQFDRPDATARLQVGPGNSFAARGTLAGVDMDIKGSVYEVDVSAGDAHFKAGELSADVRASVRLTGLEIAENDELVGKPRVDAHLDFTFSGGDLEGAMPLYGKQQRFKLESFQLGARGERASISHGPDGMTVRVPSFAFHGLMGSFNVNAPPGALPQLSQAGGRVRVGDPKGNAEFAAVVRASSGRGAQLFFSNTGGPGAEEIDLSLGRGATLHAAVSPPRLSSAPGGDQRFSLEFPADPNRALRIDATGQFRVTKDPQTGTAEMMFDAADGEALRLHGTVQRGSLGVMRAGKLIGADISAASIDLNLSRLGVRRTAAGITAIAEGGSAATPAARLQLATSLQLGADAAGATANVAADSQTELVIDELVWGPQREHIRFHAENQSSFTAQLKRGAAHLRGTGELIASVDGEVDRDRGAAVAVNVGVEHVRLTGQIPVPEQSVAGGSNLDIEGLIRDLPTLELKMGVELPGDLELWDGKVRVLGDVGGVTLLRGRPELTLKFDGSKISENAEIIADPPIELELDLRMRGTTTLQLRELTLVPQGDGYVLDWQRAWTGEWKWLLNRVGSWLKPTLQQKVTEAMFGRSPIRLDREHVARWITAKAAERAGGAAAPDPNVAELMQAVAEAPRITEITAAWPETKIINVGPLHVRIEEGTSFEYESNSEADTTIRVADGVFALSMADNPKLAFAATGVSGKFNIVLSDKDEAGIPRRARIEVSDVAAGQIEVQGSELPVAEPFAAEMKGGSLTVDYQRGADNQLVDVSLGLEHMSASTKIELPPQALQP